MLRTHFDPYVIVWPLLSALLIASLLTPGGPTKILANRPIAYRSPGTVQIDLTDFRPEPILTVEKAPSGEDAQIDVEKTTNGVDADSAPGPFVAAGEAITWTYTLTNTGNVDLTSIALSDSDLGAIPCSQTALSPQEAMTCEAYGTAIEGQYGNTAVVTGTSPLGLEVTDDDPSHYFGAEPGLTVAKATNGVEAESPPGPYILVADPITWTVVVTNTGNITLTQITVLDDEEGPFDCATATLGEAESTEWTTVGTAVVGQYANMVTVSGLPPVGSAVTATATSHYFGTDPQIVMTKRTNSIDVEDPPGPTLWVGDPVTWTYTVSNTGNVTLTQLALIDDQTGAIACAVTALAPNETTVCRADGVATVGQYTNVGIASARPPGSLAPIETTDTSYYFGRTPSPSISLEKRTNGVSADVAPGVYVIVGAPVTWTYEIANTGDAELTDIALTDNQGTPEDDTDDVTVCTLDALSPTASSTCVLTGTALAGQYRNEALVTGTAPDGAVTDTATSHYHGITPAIVVEKAVSSDGLVWHDADDAESALELAVDGELWWCITVSNTGNTSLTLTVDDTRYGSPFDLSIVCDAPPPAVLPAQAHYRCTFRDPDGPRPGAQQNVVKAQGRFGQLWIGMDSDVATYLTADRRVFLPLVMR